MSTGKMKILVPEYRTTGGDGQSRYIKVWALNGGELNTVIDRHNDEWWAVVANYYVGDELVAHEKAGPWGITTLADAKRARSDLVRHIRDQEGVE